MTANRLVTTARGTNVNAFQPIDWGLFMGLSLIWGASFLFMAIGLDSFHPGLITWLRVGFGALVLVTFPKRPMPPIAREDLPQVTLLSIIWVAIPLTLFPIAQQWVTSSVAGMLNGAVPIFTAIIATVLLRQLPGRLQLAGLIIGFVGMSAIALSSSSEGATAAIGVALILVATVGYGFATNIVAPLQQRYGSLTVMTRLQTMAFVMVTPFGLYGLFQSGFAWPSLFATAAVGVLGTGLAFVMMGTLAGRVGPTRSSFITYLIPVVALLLGVVLRDEAVSAVAIVGSALVIFGALLASRREA
jgi:drug/metabolite transporter (DMT)-like permease